VADAVRVLIVEDHLVLAEALSSLLEEYEGLTVVGQAATVMDAVLQARHHRPDVVLMDFQLPDGTGAQATEAIRRENPDTAVVFLSADDTPGALLAAVEMGASGYLLKSESGSKVADSVRRAAQGEMLVPPSVLAALLASQRDRARQDQDRERLLGDLTGRERDVLALMATGLDNNTIAERLGIGVTTVRGHVQHVLEKLDAHSKLEAVTRAAQYGLVEI
jgi:DNA-binding NarL/FixJ family response regulator